jgi:hypothetical protein
MKIRRLKVVFKNEKEESLDADRYEQHDDSYIFYKGDRALQGSVPVEAVEYIVEEDFDMPDPSEWVDVSKLDPK